MTNGELIAILQRFPPEGKVRTKRSDQILREAVEIDHAEMAIDPEPTTLQAQNIGWADLIKDKIGVVLVWAEPLKHSTQAQSAQSATSATSVALGKL